MRAEHELNTIVARRVIEAPRDARAQLLTSRGRSRAGLDPPFVRERRTPTVRLHGRRPGGARRRGVGVGAPLVDVARNGGNTR